MGELPPAFNMVQFTGKFTRTSAENYDEFLKALNVGFLLRKAATASTPVMEITENDGNWVMKTSTSMKSIELKFKLGVPFQENKLITSQKATKKGDKDVTAVREFFDDKLIMTMTCEGVVSTQVYKRD